jgi:hypothetical protein
LGQATAASPSAPTTTPSPPSDARAELESELRRLHAAGGSLRGIAKALDGRLSKSGVAKALRRLGLVDTASAVACTDPPQARKDVASDRR